MACGLGWPYVFPMEGVSARQPHVPLTVGEPTVATLGIMGAPEALRCRDLESQCQ